jgi:hypothetical protein
MDLLDKESSNKLLYISAGFIVLALIFLVLSDLIIMSLLVLLSLGISYFVYFTKLKSIGIELASFVIVITGFVYGPMWGAFLGLFLMGFHILISQYLGPYVLWVIPEYIILGIAAGTFATNVAMFGIDAVLTINAFNIIMTFLTYKQNMGKYIIFAVTNILFNFFLFSVLGAGVVGLLG